MVFSSYSLSFIFTSVAAVASGADSPITAKQLMDVSTTALGTGITQVSGLSLQKSSSGLSPRHDLCWEELEADFLPQLKELDAIAIESYEDCDVSDDGYSCFVDSDDYAEYCVESLGGQMFTYSVGIYCDEEDYYTIINFPSLCSPMSCEPVYTNFMYVRSFEDSVNANIEGSGCWAYVDLYEVVSEPYGPDGPGGPF